MLELSDLASDAWRPPIIAAVATEKQGIDQLWSTVLAHRDFISSTHELERRREFRLREELREIVARRLEQRARLVVGDDRWTELQRGVIGHTIDPWSAADEMLGPAGA
jgi:LAO/AO transport system kinase